MKKIIALVGVVFASLTVFADGDKLIGTWKSNKEATMAYLQTHAKLTADQLAKLTPILGKMTMTFDAKNITVKSGDWGFTGAYKIVSETKDSITIESDDPDTKKPSQNIFEFEGNSFWCPDAKIPGFKEKFDKVVPK